MKTGTRIILVCTLGVVFTASVMIGVVTWQRVGLAAAIDEDLTALHMMLDSGVDQAIVNEKIDHIADETDHAMKATQTKAGLIALLACGLSVGIGLLLLRPISRTIGQVADFTRAMREGDLGTRLPAASGADRPARDDELTGLQRNLNAMADALEAKSRVAERIATGDLSGEVPLASSRDSLGKTLQGMVTNLRDLIRATQETSDSVLRGSNQIAEAGNAMSRGATEQAASLEEITSSMTEINSQTRHNADSAGQARQLANSARQDSEQGIARMEDMLSSMGEIQESSQEIAKILKAVDDIAFQTNLLALNAAVEAARAGRHGKGFAVVAEEVRSLAGRSAKSAAETASLIEASSRRIERGLQLAREATDAFESIVEGVTRTADLVGEIAAAANEQAEGIGQVSEGLGQVDQVTQSNAASAEQTASASRELSGRADRLQSLMSVFRLDEATSAAVPAAGDAAAPVERRTETTTADSSAPPPSAISSARVPVPVGAPAAADSAWDTMKPGVPQLPDADPRPEDVIKLDADDFGRY